MQPRPREHAEYIIKTDVEQQRTQTVDFCEILASQSWRAPKKKHIGELGKHADSSEPFTRVPRSSTIYVRVIAYSFGVCMLLNRRIDQ